MNEDNFLKEVVLDIIRELIYKGELKLLIDIIPGCGEVEYGFGGIEKYSCFKILTHLTSEDNLVGYWENNFNSSVLKDILVGKGDGILGKTELEEGFNLIDRRFHDELNRIENNRSAILAELDMLKEQIKFLQEQLLEKKNE